MKQQEAVLAAILTSDLSAIEPALTGEAETESVQQWLALAEKQGDPRMVARILRKTKSGWTDWPGLLVSYLRRLSEDSSAAGWLTDLEYVVWAALDGRSIPNFPFPSLVELDSGVREDLRYLSGKSDGWVRWDEEAETPVHVPRKMWIDMFARRENPDRGP